MFCHAVRFATIFVCVHHVGKLLKNSCISIISSKQLYHLFIHVFTGDGTSDWVKELHVTMHGQQLNEY